MKNIRIYLMLPVMMAFSVSCQDDDYELGQIPAREAIDFEVIQDFTADPGGNTVILKINSPGVVAMWDYETGRSNRQQDTIRYPFKGEYDVALSVLTDGGVLDVDVITIQVTKDNLSYLSHPLWSVLAGGVGQEKTWLMDANENTESKFFTSPVYFAGMDNAYGTISLDGRSVYWSKKCEVEDGPNCWTYEPNYKSDTWAAPAQDYGTMTFSLIDGPFIKTDHKGVAGIGLESGTYSLNVENSILTITDATPLTVPYGPNDAASLNTMRILSLTDSTMQLAFKNKAKDEYFVINYISKEYADAWQPKPEVDPDFDHGDQLEILANGSSKAWRLDTQVPFNWFDIAGNSLNEEWTSRAAIMELASWTGFDDADVDGFDAAFVQFSTDGNVLVRQDDGTSASGTYVIDEATNTITFTDVIPKIVIAGWIAAETTAENKWKIVKVERTGDQVTGLWLGKRDPNKAEYMVFHFVLR